MLANHGVTLTSAGAMITDSNGDTLTLNHVTAATLAVPAHGVDFKFV